MFCNHDGKNGFHAVGIQRFRHSASPFEDLANAYNRQRSLQRWFSSFSISFRRGEEKRTSLNDGIRKAISCTCLRMNYGFARWNGGGGDGEKGNQTKNSKRRRRTSCKLGKKMGAGLGAFCCAARLFRFPINTCRPLLPTPTAIVFYMHYCPYISPSIDSRIKKG